MDYRRIVDEIFRQFTGLRFSIKYWDGHEIFYGEGTRPVFSFIIRDQVSAQRLLAQGSIGFGESYMEDRIQIEGDLEAYLRLRHQFKNVRRSFRLALAKYIAGWSIPHNREKQISHHYDIGNDFFRMILDHQTMSYSAGRFEKGENDLDRAQLQKLKLMCQWLEVSAHSRVLDLGSGWGNFAFYSEDNFHWQVTGYILSKAQLDYCRLLAGQRQAAQSPQFEYHDMLNKPPSVEFDGVVMLESLEHVGRERLPHFFRQLQQCVKPGGPIVIQTSGRYKPRPLDRWTRAYVFPGGYLPAKSELIDAIIRSGLTIERFQDDTADYIQTMTLWIHNLEQHRKEIEARFGRPFYRIWELWMHGARVAFTEGTMNLFRLRLRRPKT